MLAVHATLTIGLKLPFDGHLQWSESLGVLAASRSMNDGYVSLLNTITEQFHCLSPNEDSRLVVCRIFAEYDTQSKEDVTVDLIIPLMTIN